MKVEIGVPPGNSTEGGPLRHALARVKREFPGASLYEVRLEFSLGERSPDQAPADLSWLRAYWRVQVDNDHASEATLDESIAALRRDLEIDAKVQAWAERIAAVSLEVFAEVKAAKGDGRDRWSIERAVERILGEERHP